jgi:hypothetical protein
MSAREVSVLTLAEATAVDAYVAALLAQAPPLTGGRRDRLTLLLRGPRRDQRAA